MPKPTVPYTPAASIVLLPFTQVHTLVSGSNFQRSLRFPVLMPEAPRPLPPKIQKSPFASVQLTQDTRAAGTFPAAGVPCVPYVPLELIRLEPETQVHKLVSGSNFHRSFSGPVAAAELSRPVPPNTHTSPASSSHIAAPERAPGTFPTAGLPTVPYAPAALVTFAPLSQVHWFVAAS